MSTFTYDHIHIRSRDPEKTAAYYERMFDAEIIRSVQEGQPRIDMKIGGQDVFIAPVPEKSNVNPPPAAGRDPDRRFATMVQSRTAHTDQSVFHTALRLRSLLAVRQVGEGCRVAFISKTHCGCFPLLAA